MGDNRVFSRLAALGECLCSEVEDVAFCGIVPGDAAISDYMRSGDDSDECGMAWVRLMSLFPSGSVGEQNILPGNCSGGMSMIVEIGVLRCIGVGDDNGEPPPASDLLSATDQQIEDALAMQRALVCCAEIPNQDWILGSYAPTGPSGGIYGGTWQATVGI